jgi:hypothetical protein
VAIGFQAPWGRIRPPRGATGSFTFSANPASADYLLLGYKLTKQVNFLASPSGALDVQLGASLPVTLMNATALLNASTDTTINPVTYWATTSGRLVLEHDTVNINTFWIKSMSSVATASSWRMQGGTSARPRTMWCWVRMRCPSPPPQAPSPRLGAGQYSNLVNSAILSPSACLNGQNVLPGVISRWPSAMATTTSRWARGSAIPRWKAFYPSSRSPAMAPSPLPRPMAGVRATSTSAPIRTAREEARCCNRWWRFRMPGPWARWPPSGRRWCCAWWCSMPGR